jgi:hypothetical protein
MSTTTDTVITLDPRAVQTIERMTDHVTTLGRFYGTASPAHAIAAASLAHSLRTMIRLGGRITEEGELSLYGVSFIDYGVVFHPAARPDGYAEVADAPQPGEWTVHS